eukprot:3915368-Rhodomonas_salina.1
MAARDTPVLLARVSERERCMSGRLVGDSWVLSCCSLARVPGVWLSRLVAGGVLRVDACGDLRAGWIRSAGPWSSDPDGEALPGCQYVGKRRSTEERNRIGGTVLCWWLGCGHRGGSQQHGVKRVVAGRLLPVGVVEV